MTPKKRTAKPRTVVTDATKAKLPAPTRKRKVADPAKVQWDKDEQASRAIPCGEDIAPRFPNGLVDIGPARFAQRYPSPIPSQNPWPVRVLNWLDEAPAKARRTIAAWLRALAGKVDV